MGPEDVGLYCPLMECSECKDVNGRWIDGRADCDDCYLGGHAVTIIGWGRGHSPGQNTSTTSSSRGDGYWIVKNSWGKHWGEEGVFRISADYASNCNLLIDCTDPARSTDCAWGINFNNPMGWVPPDAPAPDAPVGKDVSVDAAAMPGQALLATHTSRATGLVSPPVTPSAENVERVLASVTGGLAALRCMFFSRHLKERDREGHTDGRSKGGEGQRRASHVRPLHVQRGRNVWRVTCDVRYVNR